MFAKLAPVLLGWSALVRAITVTSSSSSLTIDAGNSYGFVTVISKSTCDITSLKYYGTEYQYSGTYSHIASGLGSGTEVSYSTTGKHHI